MSDEKRQLTPRDWAEIEEKWSLGDTTLEQLSTDYKVSVAHLSRSLAERGVKKGSKAAEVKLAIQEAVHEQHVTDAVEQMRRIEETKDEHYKYAKTLAALAFRLVAKQIQNKQSISAVKDDVKTVREALQALQIARNERWAVLGLDQDPDTGEESTTLIVQEMTQGDLQAVRDRHKNAGIDEDVAEVEKMLNEAEAPLAIEKLPSTDG